MISRILFVLLTWPATSAGKQLGRLLVSLTRRDAGLIWPLLPILNFLAERGAVRPRSSHLYYPTKRLKTEVLRLMPKGLYLMCSRRISSTRACQPAPDARKASTTSGDSRIETGTFRGAFCGPRLRLEIFWRNLEGSLSNVTARANSSRVHSGFSGSPACLTALFVIFSFTFGRLSEADRPHIVAFLLVHEDQRIQPDIQEADRAESNLAVIFAGVDGIQGLFKVEVFSPAQRDAMFPSVGLVFLRVVRDHSLSLIVYTIK